MGTRKELKVGDLVRVAGNSFASEYKPGKIRHHFKAGAVCEVLKVYEDSVLLEGPYRHDVRLSETKATALGTGSQTVRIHQVTFAVQAMLEREAIAMVRAGNLPKPRNKTPLAERMRRIYQYKNRR